MKRKIMPILLSTMLLITTIVPISFAESLSSAEIKPYAHDVEMKRELVNTDYEKTGYKVAGGQPSGGVKFTTSGGGFNWSSGGSSLPVSFSLGYGVVSTSIDLGNTSSGVGYSIKSPYVNQFCKLYIDTTVEIKRYAVYQRYIGTNSPWTFVRYETIIDNGYNHTFAVRLA